MRRLRSLSEAECYLRCYGAPDEAVRVLWARDERPVARRRRRLTGEEVRQLFEPRVARPVREAA